MKLNNKIKTIWLLLFASQICIHLFFIILQQNCGPFYWRRRAYSIIKLDLRTASQAFPANVNLFQSVDLSLGYFEGD